MGFVRGTTPPREFHHPTRGVRCVVHGDDFTVPGNRKQLKWLRDPLEEAFGLRLRAHLGEASDADTQATTLKWIRAVTPNGLEYEADPRQVEKLLEEIELEGDGVKGAVTPSVKPLQHQIAAEAPLPEQQHTRFRALAARANYLAADRVDVIYAAKEVCGFMAKPTDLALQALKRLGTSKPGPELYFPCHFSNAAA